MSVRRGHDLQETEDQTTEAEPEAETFPRSYVENPRQENVSTGNAHRKHAAITDLISRKPHLASRRPAGEIGQGASPSTANVDLAAILRQRAG